MPHTPTQTHTYTCTDEHTHTRTYSHARTSMRVYIKTFVLRKRYSSAHRIWSDSDSHRCVWSLQCCRRTSFAFVSLHFIVCSLVWSIAPHSHAPNRLPWILFACSFLQHQHQFMPLLKTPNRKLNVIFEWTKRNEPNIIIVINKIEMFSVWFL